MNSIRKANLPVLLSTVALLTACATTDDLTFTFDTSVDSASDTFHDSVDPPADTVYDTYTDPGTDTLWADTLLDTGYDTWTDTGFDTWTDTGYDTWTDTGYDTWTDTGFDTWTDTGFDTWTDTGFDTWTDTGTDTGVDTIMDTTTDTAGHHTWSEYFDGTSNITQCSSFESFRASMATSGYTTMTFSGTYDPTGITCTDPTVVQQYADALRLETSVHLSCDGHVWSLCNRSDHMEVWVDAPSMCDLSNCPNPGYIIRPCFSTDNVWCAANEDTCLGVPQSVTLDFY